MLLNFPLIRFALCLILGISLAHYLKPNFYLTLYLTTGLTAIIGMYWFALRHRIIRSPFFSILVYLSMTAIGMHAYNGHNEKLQPDHYTHLNLDEAQQSIVFKITERLKPDSYNNKYMASVLSVNQKSVIGTLLVQIQKDSTEHIFPVDAIIFSSSALETIPKPLNPHQFDYNNYLQLKQVYHQISLKTKELRVISERPRSIFGFADRLRATINDKLINAGFKGDVLTIMNALLLGQRQSIDKNTYTNYVNSGTIHILAVSGLHVGLLLLILNVLFSPLLYLKHGSILRPLIIVALLWLFAIIAGLSPSVTRAVTMFSLICIAMHLKRPSNIYNTLAISAFFILLMKPTFLFEVGFQMSYLAVLGIVSCQPILYKLWIPKYSILDRLWQIFTVTLAAQIGVLPISLFYFHQFPGLFFISNVVVLPCLGLILGLGLLVIALALMNLCYPIITSVYSFIIECLNAFIAWMGQFEAFLFRDIPFTLTQVICAYVMIFTLIQAYQSKSFKWLCIGLISIIGFQSTFMYHKYKTRENAFIIFNKSRHTLLGEKRQDKLMVYHNLDSVKWAADHTISNYAVGEMIREVTTDSLASVYQLDTKTILIIDSIGVYKNMPFQPDYILLRNSPKINLNRVIEYLHPQKIIADASNYKSYIERWKATCYHKKIPFHNTNEKGAFIWP